MNFIQRRRVPFITIITITIARAGIKCKVQCVVYVSIHPKSPCGNTQLSVGSRKRVLGVRETNLAVGAVKDAVEALEERVAIYTHVSRVRGGKPKNTKFRTDKIKPLSAQRAHVGCDQVDRVVVAAEGRVHAARPDLRIDVQFVAGLFVERNVSEEHERKKTTYGADVKEQALQLCVLLFGNGEETSCAGRTCVKLERCKIM